MRGDRAIRPLAQYLAPHRQQPVQARGAWICRECFVISVEDFEWRATISRFNFSGVFAFRMPAQEFFAQRQPFRGILLFIQVSSVSGALFLPQKRLSGPL